MKSYLLAALLAGSATAQAQSIRGTVTSSNGPIVGASVRLLELDRIERTDAQGGFRFAAVPRGTYRVYVGVTGYAAVTDTVRLTRDTASIAFRLTPTAIPLKEVVVSASPTARPADEEYAPAESKSQIDFDNTAGASFAEKINDLPGVNARWNGSAAARPILRGLGDNDVLVLENGLRMGDIATFDPAHATPIDALSITQVDVVRGPATILYGSSTVGGIVNVITNLVPTPSDHPLSGTAALEANSVSSEYAGYTNTVFTSGGSAFHVSAGGLHSTNVGIPAGIYPDPASGTPFALHSIPASDDRTAEEGAGYSYQGDFGMIGLGGRHFNTDYGIPGLPPNVNWLTVPPTTSRIHQQRNTGELKALFNTGSNVFDHVKIDASYNDYLHSEFPTQQDSTGVSDPQANHFHKVELNGMLQLEQHAIGNLSGTIGLFTDIQDLTIEGQQPLGPNSRTTNLAAYAYEEYRLLPGTRLQAGVRYDYNKIQTRPYGLSQDSTFQTIDESRLSNAVTASLGAVQHLSSGLTASLSLARSFRAPTVQELFANGLDASSGTYSIGTASLVPEVGYGIDASLKGSFANAAFELSPYVNFISHYIYGFLTGDTIQGFPVRQFTTSDARLFGFEAAATVQPVNHIALRASTDYVNAENTQLGIPLPFIPPLRGLLRAAYQDATYMGMIEWRGAAAQTRLGVGDTETSGYALFNLGVGIRLPQGGVVHNISLHLDNVFNRRYYDAVSVIKTWVAQPGRGVRLNYEILY
ncbi:MAG TPA: TonB-dependent receptor [Gemmatimonadaceae bacterium]|nr:TonB-dependent receptor [Gemmatimonadaceae bacterium]